MFFSSHIMSFSCLPILILGVLLEIVGCHMEQCVTGIGLKYISEQMDLDCIKNNELQKADASSEQIWNSRNAAGKVFPFSAGSQTPSVFEQMRSKRSAANRAFPFPINNEAIPKSLMEIHADMKELLATGRELRMARKSDEFCTEKGCYDLPASPCETVTDVVTPINATSATSGETVWIAQYPGLFIQTITYSKCKQSRCFYLNGGCRQLFSPYLLMTHPPGPVSIFGQDYVLVESGCTCEPALSSNRSLNNNMELYLPQKSPRLP